MGISDLINKYSNMLKELPAERQRVALEIGNNAKALISSRVQNEGLNDKNEKFPLYSKNPLPLNYFVSSNKGADTRFKKDVNKGVISSSYENYRKYHGLPTDKRTTTFTGDMWKDVIAEITLQTETTTEVTISARSKHNQDKINSNSKYAKANILSLTLEEEALINEVHKKSVENFLKKYE